MSVEDEVRRFITRDLKWEGRTEDLTDDLALLDSRILDSLGLFKLVSFLEGEYGIDIDDEELVPDNFGSIGSIAALVNAKR